MLIVSGTAVRYHSGKPPVPIRWVLVRDPRGGLELQAFLCTHPQATAQAKQDLGLDEANSDRREARKLKTR